MASEKQVASLIREAVKLHGHLGPFLVIGVRMGNLVERTFNLNTEDKRELRACIRIPSFTPFSCALDGIQVTTNCTIGNRRLEVGDSEQKIVGRFELRSSGKMLLVSVNPEVVRELLDEISRGVANEELAARIEAMPERRLFVTVEK